MYRTPVYLLFTLPRKYQNENYGTKAKGGNVSEAPEAKLMVAKNFSSHPPAIST